LAVSKRPDPNSNFQYVIFPSYIQKYVPNLDNSFFYLGYCHSLQNDKMLNVLKGKGAKVVFGWDDAVYMDTNVRFFDELMQRMLPASKTIEPLSAQEALVFTCKSNR
jgi:hypothetical protein